MATTGASQRNLLKTLSGQTHDIKQKFAKAQRHVRELPSEPAMDNDTKLLFYSLFKQGTVGDVNIGKPRFFDPVGQAKYDAWERRKGMPVVDAQIMYVNELNKRLKAYDKPTI